jgi:hypothetical protein
MIRYKVYHRQIKQVCEVVVRDNEKNRVVLEYVDRSESHYPYKIVKKRISVEINGDLRTVRFAERYDMQNNPIYDGDVIKEHDFLSGKSWVGLVRWNKEKGQFVEEITGTPFASLKLSAIEKVGNIWEKPELLGLIQDNGEDPTNGDLGGGPNPTNGNLLP